MRVRALLLSLLVSFAVSPLRAGDEPYRIAIPLPLTGPEAKFGEMEKHAYELGASEVNAAGGVNGRRLELEFLDSGGSVQNATAIVEKLITVAKQPIIVGEYSSQNSYAAAALAERYEVPYLVVTGAADKITQQGWKWVFRMNPPSSLYADGITDFFANVAHPRSIAILYENSDFGTSTANAMREWCEANRVEVVLELPITEKLSTAAVDLRPVLQKVKGAKPDVVYAVAYLAEATRLVKTAREMDLAPKAFIGGAAGFTMPEFLDGARDAAEHVMSGTLWTPQAKYPGARAFFERFKARYGKEPDYHGAEAYAAVAVLADTLRRAKSYSAPDLRQALSETNLKTAFGPVRFVSFGRFTNQNRLSGLLVQVIGGKYETVWPREVATTRPVYPASRGTERK